MMEQFSVDAFSLPLFSGQILHEMGYGVVEPRPELVDLVDTLLEEVKKTAAPSCCFQLYDGKICEEKVLLENGSQFRMGKILSALLEGSTRFALFTATAGGEFQAYQKELNAQGDMLRCFIVDVIGSSLAEAVGDRMEVLLEQQVLPDRHTHRFSPGYCGWPLTEQQILFPLLGGRPCGIHLSKVCLMTPEKSISGLMGIGQAVNEKVYGCRYCELETCYKRKRKNNE